jgi:pimeloyl-ACP methyl ester carboxylesterase
MMPMERPDDCCHHDRLRRREATDLPASEGHSVPVCHRNGLTIATSHPLDRVVLLPCSASSARQWKALAEQLPTFRSLPLDLWGHGNQGRWHGTRPLSLAEEAAAIHETCTDGTPFHLIGHSYGGGVALRFALSHPQSLRSLTLIEPSSFHVLKEAQGTDAHLLAEIRAVADAVNRGVICGDYASGMQTFIDYWGGAGSWESLSDDKKVQFGHLAVHIAHHFWSLIEENTSLSAYTAIDVPTLILCGTRSPAPSRAITRLLAETLPHARHRTIRGAGHMSPITHTGDVNGLVVEHVLTNRASVRMPTNVAANLPIGERAQGFAEDEQGRQRG